MELSKRIEKIVEYSGLSIPKFAEFVGFKTPQVIRELLKGNTKSVSFQVQEKIKAAYPELNIVWLVTGKGDMILHSSTSQPLENNEDTRPRVDQYAAGGGNEALDGVTLAQCEQIPVVPMFPRYDFTMRVTGESMQPYINPGDEVACLKIEESSFLQWGRIYVLFTSQGVIVKKIFDVGDGIRCVSFNENYPDFTIPKSEIYSFNLVIGLVRLCN
jgi:phage repressor protein C with HTH and peptisase S24 domain